jgi:hypothetical protein
MASLAAASAATMVFVLTLVVLTVIALCLAAARRRRAAAARPKTGGAMPAAPGAVPVFAPGAPGAPRELHDLLAGMQNAWAGVLGGFIALRDGPPPPALPRRWDPVLAPALQGVERALDDLYDASQIAQNAATDAEVYDRLAQPRTAAVDAVDTLTKLSGTMVPRGRRPRPLRFPPRAMADAILLKDRIYTLPGWTRNETIWRGPKAPYPPAEVFKAPEVLEAATFGSPKTGRPPAFLLAHSEREVKDLLALYERPGEGGRMLYVVLVDKAGDESLLLTAACALVGLRPAPAAPAATPAAAAGKTATGWLYKMVLIGNRAVRRIVGYVGR